MSTVTSRIRHTPTRSERLIRAFKRTGWRHLVAWAFCAFALMPLVYVLSAALNPQGTLTGSNRLFRTVGLDSFERLLTSDQYPFLTWFKNSLIIGLTTAVLSVFLGAMAAYAFSRMRFRGRRTGLMSLVLVQMFPQLLAVVAIFILLTKIGEVVPALGLNTHAGLIAV